MKLIFALLLMVSVPAFSQLKLDFPDDLLFDPYDYKIARLGFTEVEQYWTYEVPEGDSIPEGRVLFGVSYAVKYDSLHRLSSFRFGFEPINDWRSYRVGENDNAWVTRSITDSLRYHFLTHNDTTHIRAFQSYVFNYDGSGLTGIDHVPSVQEPPIVIDGIVYPIFEVDKVYREVTERMYNEKSQLIQKRVIDENGNVRTLKYFYKTFITSEGEEIDMLDYVEKTWDDGAGKVICHVKYTR